MINMGVNSGEMPACRDRLPVSVRPSASLFMSVKEEICYTVGRPNWNGARTDTGAVPTSGR